MKELKYFAIGSLVIVVVFILTVVGYGIKVFGTFNKIKEANKGYYLERKRIRESPTIKAVIKSNSTVLTPIS